ATLVSGLRKAEGDDLPVLEDRGPPGGTAQAERAASEGASTAQKVRARGNGHDANAEGDDAKKEGEQKQAATDPDLVEMNDKFAVVKVGGKKDENGDERKIGIGCWWINHEQRRQYDGIVYDLGADAKATHGKLNLWTASVVRPLRETAPSTWHTCETTCTSS